jgi:septal ring factor EnvC (AmiA/AmiB activator)
MTRPALNSKLTWWLLGIFATAIVTFSAWAGTCIVSNATSIAGLERDITYIREALERIEASVLRTDETLDKLRDELAQQRKVNL